MTERKDEVWKSSALVETYLHDVRGAIPLANEQIDVMMRLIAAREEGVESFLDLGCGDGILAAAILDTYPDSKGVLLDFSKPMIESAQAKLDQYSQHLVFETVDYGESNWVENVTLMTPFDVVVSGFSIHHQPDERKRQLYAEIYDLLKPNGLFVNVEHVSSPTNWIENVWSNYMIDALYAHSVKEDAGKTREQAAEEFYHRPDKDANILAPVELQCDWLRQIGYEDVDCYLKVLELAVFGGKRPV